MMGHELIPLDLVTCRMAVTNLTLPVWALGRPGRWILATSGEFPDLFYRQQAEIFGRGYDHSQAFRQIMN